MSKKMLNEVAVVVIGRNEGQRLLSCFASFLEKTKNDFSHLYSILSNPETREYIGLGMQPIKAEQILDEPIPETHHKQLRNLMTWLYGSSDEKVSPVIVRQGEDRPKLQKVIACEAALEKLEQTGDFESAQHVAGIDVEDWLSNVFRLDDYAQSVFRTSSDVIDTLGDEDKVKAKEQLKKTIGRIEKIMNLVG